MADRCYANHSLVLQSNFSKLLNLLIKCNQNCYLGSEKSWFNNGVYKYRLLYVCVCALTRARQKFQFKGGTCFRL